jgi:hypothetical protein
MASIRIHQDLFNFERKRKGFTNRQLVSLGAAIVIGVASAALFGYALQLNYTIVASLSLICALPAVLAGFFPIHNMPAEEFVSRLVYMHERGNVLCWESIEVPTKKGVVSKEYVRSQKQKGFEFQGHDL